MAIWETKSVMQKSQIHAQGGVNAGGSLKGSLLDKCWLVVARYCLGADHGSSRRHSLGGDESRAGNGAVFEGLQVQADACTRRGSRRDAATGKVVQPQATEPTPQAGGEGRTRAIGTVALHGRIPRMDRGWELNSGISPTRCCAGFANPKKTRSKDQNGGDYWVGQRPFHAAPEQTSRGCRWGEVKRAVSASVNFQAHMRGCVQGLISVRLWDRACQRMRHPSRQPRKRRTSGLCPTRGAA